MVKRKFQIFVSSTYDDLKNERQSAVEAILEAGHIPAGMELFAAGDKSQLETIKKWIDASDMYLLILGGRYGSIEPETGLSYIELEYKYASEKEKPLFAIVIRENELPNRKPEFIEKDNPDKLVTFRKYVLGKTSLFFSDTKDIKIAIHKSVNELSEEREMIGWVRGIYAKTEDELQKVNDLYEYNNKLEKELNELKNILGKDTSDLAQGSDVVNLDFSIKGYAPKEDITWDELFMVIANQCIEERGSSSNEFYIKEAVVIFIGTKINLQNRAVMLEDNQFNENFKKIKLQFIALEYFDIETKLHTPKNILGTFWKLSRKGIEHLTELMAIRKNK